MERILTKRKLSAAKRRSNERLKPINPKRQSRLLKPGEKKSPGVVELIEDTIEEVRDRGYHGYREVDRSS